MLQDTRAGLTRSFVPADEREVVEILKAASESNTPVTVAGAGYGLTGGRVAEGGWVLSLEKFRRLEIHEGFARVGAAVSLLEVRDAARPSGQFYAPDPTEINSSVGGTIATNASGSRSFQVRKYAPACERHSRRADGWTRGGLSPGRQDRLPCSGYSDPERD